MLDIVQPLYIVFLRAGIRLPGGLDKFEVRLYRLLRPLPPARVTLAFPVGFPVDFPLLILS